MCYIVFGGSTDYHSPLLTGGSLFVRTWVPYLSIRLNVHYWVPVLGVRDSCWTWYLFLEKLDPYRSLFHSSQPS